MFCQLLTASHRNIWSMTQFFARNRRHLLRKYRFNYAVACWCQRLVNNTIATKTLNICRMGPCSDHTVGSCTNGPRVQSCQFRHALNWSCSVPCDRTLWQIWPNFVHRDCNRFELGGSLWKELTALAKFLGYFAAQQIYGNLTWRVFLGSGFCLNYVSSKLHLWVNS